MSEHKKGLKIKDRYKCEETYGPFIKGETYSIESLMGVLDNTILMMDKNRNLTYINVTVLKTNFKKV